MQPRLLDVGRSFALHGRGCAALRCGNSCMMPNPLINTEPWMNRAICRGQWKRFDSDRGAARGTYREEITACGYCPVLDDCRRHTLELRPDGGVWAAELIPSKGSTVAHRDRVFARIADALGVPYERPRLVRRRPPAEHGTYAGYTAHRKNGEIACDRCKAANTEYQMRYQAARAKAVQT